MRLIISFVIVLALVVCTGCAQQESAPADQAPTTQEAPSVEEAPIASEDFESGEVEGAVSVGESEEEEETQPQGDDSAH